MLFNFDYMTGGSIAEGDFSFAGKYEFLSDGSGNFELILFESGVLTWYTDPGDVDICLVAGGMPGSNNPGDYGDSSGGDGGEVVNITNQQLTAGAYTATVGQSGQNTVLETPSGTWTAHSGQGSPHGNPGSDGALAWGDPSTLLRPGVLYGPGGGDGSVLDYRYVVYDAYPGGSVGAADDGAPNGHGGTPDHPAGYDGLAGTGQGGGGGRREWTVYKGSYYYAQSPGGKGGSGAILIRNHKEVSS